MDVADENLRHAGTAVGHHLLPLGRVQVDADSVHCWPLLFRKFLAATQYGQTAVE